MPSCRDLAEVPLLLCHARVPGSGQGIGLTVWQLRKGVKIESASMADPTHIRANWSCTNGLDEGAGALVMNWYKKNNR